MRASSFPEASARDASAPDANTRLMPRSVGTSSLGRWWLLLLVAAGLLQAMSLAWPWARAESADWLSLPGGYGRPLWWLQILSLALAAAALLDAPTRGQSAGRAWLFATTWLCGTFWWLFISMHKYGGLAAPLAAIAVLALAAFLGSFYALAAAILSSIFRRYEQIPRAQAATVFASLWTLAELARGWLWTGFPWGASGYAHVEGPLAVLPRWVGVYGTGWVAAWLAAWLALLCVSRHAQPARCLSKSFWWGLAVVAALWLTLWQLREASVSAPSPRPALSVDLLQGNIPQDEKFEMGSGIPQALAWYLQSLQLARAQLVVAPETAIPLLPQQLPEGYLDLIAAPFVHPQGQQAALVGIPLGSEEAGYTNSVLGWKPGQAQAYQYAKHHLVPFGEFIPPLFRWFTNLMNIPLGDFNRGALGQASLQWRDERLSPNICYEDLFGEELAAHFSDTASAPTVLVNLSNIGWFDDSVALDQHLAISRMRTLEFERPMLRATNTGATVAIDHAGRVTAALAPASRAVLHAQVQGRDNITPYARWVSVAGLLPLTVFCLCMVLLAFWRARHGH